MRLSWLKFTKFAVIALVAVGAKTAHAYNLSPISFANFYQIAAEGDLQGLKNVEHRGLNLNSTNQNGDTAVCVAIKRKDYLAYKTLIRAGAKSNPDCVERIPEYAHKNFLANYNQKYAAPKTPINWTKSGTAFVVGGGIAAGVVAAAGLGGGGGGGSKGGSDDSGDTSACAMNPCAEGCYENLTCPSGYQCTQYESKCNKGCIKCEPKAECVNVPECTKGCYNELTCGEGYQCAAINKCGGCERCEKKTECQKKPCAQGCYRDLTCGEDKVCTSKNSCGGCEKCELVIPDTPDTSNARHCLIYNTAINYCDTCREGYTSVNGTCRLDKPENCSKYSYDTEKCTECENGYKLSSDGRKCEKNGSSSGDTGTCDATNYPLSVCPSTASKCDSCTPKGASAPIYKIVTCNIGYQLSSDKKSCVQGSSGGNSDPTCDAKEYQLDECPFAKKCLRCGSKYKLVDCGDGAEISEDGLSCVKAVCTAENYPLSSYNECPEHGYCKQCLDSSGTYRKRLVNCNTGYEMNSDKTLCFPICSATEYPFSECPANANCKECTGLNGITVKGIKSCANDYQLSDDGKSCVAITQEQCTEELFPLSECPDHATCSSCISTKEGSSIRHVKITNCHSGFTLNSDKTNCIVEDTTNLECNTTNFPLYTCPYNWTCNSCTIGEGVTYYRLRSCLEGYKYNSETESCIKIQTSDCTSEEYPLTKCADNMYCTSCEDNYGVKHSKFSSCYTGFKRSEDGLSCVRDENFKCDTSYYKIKDQPPHSAFTSYCTDTTGTYYHIDSCQVGTKLNQEGTNCDKDENVNLECNAANYPFSSEDHLKAVVPEAGGMEGCLYDGHYIWRITSCNQGYQINETATDCIPSGNCNEIYFPITGGCPNNAYCNYCHDAYGVQHWQINWCAKGTQLTEDKTECIEGCEEENYPLNACPTGADCSVCNDSNGSHYSFNNCLLGYKQASDGTCVAQELRPKDSDVVNDNDISISSVSDKNTVTVVMKTDPNYPDKTKEETFTIGFNNKDQPKGNIYNAQTKDASIIVDSSSGIEYGFGSVSDVSADVVNAYGGHTGTIKMNYGGGTGIIGRGNIYNAYKDSTGIIEVTNTESPDGSVIGIYSWNSFLDDYLSTKNYSLTNALGSGSIGKIKVNNALTTGKNAYGIYASSERSIIANAYNGGTGSIEVISKALKDNYSVGMYAGSSGVVYNAYSVDGSTTKGKIVVNADSVIAVGLLAEVGLVHNAYGKGSEGRIICNGISSCIGIGLDYKRPGGSNGLNGGYGYIEINVDADNGRAIGVYTLTYGNGIGSGSKGEIVINMKGKDGYIWGSGGHNGSIDGGIGIITINDTGGNNIKGLEGGGNFKGSSINITSVANNDKTIIGSLAVERDPLYPQSFSATNLGDIIIKATGSATIYGIRETTQSSSGFTSDNDNPKLLGRYDKLNEGTITIIRDYTVNGTAKTPDEPTSVAYGIVSGNIINKGTIKIEGSKNPGTNQYDYQYGIYNSVNGKVLLNYGTIDVTGGYNNYAMYNDTEQSTSFNYGTAIGDLYNVNNAVGGKLYGKIIGKNVENLVNGDATHIATSADEQDKGYIEYTLSGDDTSAVYADAPTSIRSSFNNYGVINAFNNVADGAAFLSNGSENKNYGYIKITNQKDGAVVSAIKDIQRYRIDNFGTLDVIANNTNNSTLYGIFKDSEILNDVYNSGSIKIDMSGSNNTAYGIKAKSGIANFGDITITSSNNQGSAYGIYIDGQGRTDIRTENYGNITLTDVNADTSYGIYAINGAKVYNKGKITINDNSSTENKADGKFIYVDGTSEIINNGWYEKPSSTFNTAALGGGKFVMGKNGKIRAPKVKGDITADAEITSGGFDKTYTNTGAFSGDTGDVKLNSGSALFDAILKDNDIVMTMKDFDEVVDDKSLAAYLQRNYDAKRNEQLFNSLKLHASANSLNNSLNQQLGFSLIPNFAQENMNVFRSLSNLVTDNMFSQDLTNERMMVGYDYLGQDRSSKGRVTGYENTANSSYFLADTKLNNRQRFGLGVALTRFNSDYDDDSSRKATFAQVLGSYMHDFGNHWKYAGLLRVGYADGEYKRQSDRERIEGDTSDVLYGFNNELRYNYDLGFVTLEPQLELNAYGYYQRKIKEDDAKTNSLLLDGTNNLSVESGVGLYVSKEKIYGETEGEGETGRIKARLGGSYYRELSQPYHSVRARVRDTDGYYLIESTDIFDRNRMIVRADITFNWKALEFYLRGSQFLEDKHTTVINAGVKYNF